jgi:hypothetical protein
MCEVFWVRVVGMEMQLHLDAEKSFLDCKLCEWFPSGFFSGDRGKITV